MTLQYWMSRKDEILAFQEYALGFDLARDAAGGVWLSESADQLLEIAFQLFFVNLTSDGLRLASKSVEYYLAALRQESVDPASDPAMEHVYHGLYYARWWLTGQEPTGLLRQAATSYCARLAQPPVADDGDAYLRATWFWLELGETSQVGGWLHLAEWAYNQLGNSSPDAALARKVVDRCLTKDFALIKHCEPLDTAIAQVTAWDQSSGSTIWRAIQLANTRSRILQRDRNFPDLLLEIR